MFDKERREQESDYFISNKIKRCRKCGNELDYMEKFHFADRVCCKCKGVDSLIPMDRKSSQNYIDETESFAGEKITERYAEWQRLITLAERKWHNENQLDSAVVSQPTLLKESAERVSSERIFELIGHYDNGEPIAICQEELVSIFWEVLQQRKVIT
ncbi:hypothetical protein [Pantoea sp. SORGH_AS_0659]|uniref:hypothetical protein n=1 Tax=Pantoea sp. SORGH_AS_0659 TaxID=3062597 RepID=UPI00285B1D90|nr:hypothetical protein [Pantoea sp. SORGH_AS_0659]MDR6348509.1 hypothetical protein [Pantoea sp. SORGH_AS_0659]